MCPCSAFAVLMIGVSAVTVTLSVTFPTSSAYFNRNSCAAASSTPVFRDSLNPVARVMIVYFPAGKNVRVYSPCEFVAVFHVPPVWLLEAITVACPIAAPVGSVTVP